MARGRCAQHPTMEMKTTSPETGLLSCLFSYSEEQLRTLYEAVPCGVIVRDDTGRVIFANGAAQRMLGTQPDPEGAPYWMPTARLGRAGFLSVREKEFILAARCIGVPARGQIVRHILPNVLSPVIVAGTLSVGSAIIAESTLSFLGLGVTPPTASLGQMIQGGELYVDPYWYQLVVPGGILAVLVLSFAFLGDGFRDAFDTRMLDV